MDIILDSNIYRGDFSLRSKDFVVMKDYLQKTASSLMLPQVILDEIKGLYARALTERINELKKAVRNYHHALINDEYRVNNKLLDLENAVVEYEAFIRQNLGIRDRHIIPYANEFLPEIARRAIKREKPAGMEGQGFRDVLIWLTIKEYAAMRPGKQLAFISDNTADFGNKVKDGLHESLAKECEDAGIRIHYFKSVRDFIEQHSAPIAFITFDWIQEHLDFMEVDKLILEDINEGSHELMVWYQSQTGRGAAGFPEAIDMEPALPSSLTVYELADGSYIVNFILYVDVEVEFGYIKPASPIYMGTDVPTFTEGTFETDSKSVPIALFLTLTIEKEKIVQIELAKWEIESSK